MVTGRFHAVIHCNVNVTFPGEDERPAGAHVEPVVRDDHVAVEDHADGSAGEQTPVAVHAPVNTSVDSPVAMSRIRKGVHPLSTIATRNATEVAAKTQPRATPATAAFHHPRCR